MYKKQGTYFLSSLTLAVWENVEPLYLNLYLVPCTAISRLEVFLMNMNDIGLVYVDDPFKSWTLIIIW
jgi:hypothetical protein